MPESKAVISIREQIANQLRKEIFDGALAENTKLREQALAERFGVSRGPIRDVFLQLTKEGLLVSRSNCGVVVSSALEPDLQKLVVRLRLNIEVFAVKKVIDQLDGADFKRLEKMLDALVAAFDKEDYSHVPLIDMEFHQYLVQRAGGDELLNIWQPIVFRMRMNYKRITRAAEVLAEHRQILDALKAKDQKAAVAALRENVR